MGGLYSRRRERLRGWAAILLLGAGVLGPVAHAGCFDVHVPAYLAVRPLVTQDPARALADANARIAALPHGAALHEPRTVAALYAIRAGAYQELTLLHQERVAARAGLALLHDPTDPLRLELLVTYALSFSSPATITRVLSQVKQADARLRPGSRSDVCLKIVEGGLNELRGRSDLAIRETTQAYMQSAALELPGPHVAAGEELSAALRTMGDNDEALALIRRTIRAHTAQHETEQLSIDIYEKGEILKAMGRYRRSIAALRQSRAISARLKDHQGVAYSDLRICEANIALKRFEAAKRECTLAAPVLAAGKSVSMVKEADVQLAKIDLAEGHPAHAVQLLDGVLKNRGADMLALTVAPAYLARAHANAALHRDAAAYRDLSTYLHLYRAHNRAKRTRLREALEVRFQAKQEFERNAILQRKLQAAANKAAKQSQLMHWMEAAGIAGALAITLLSYILITDRRHRRQLVLLANQDPLTGVPNRGHTAQMAIAALHSAHERGQPLTVALIDFDYFKAINDQCGHAAGDHVLREFARLSRGALRATDILGRWGGEEFLLVLPDATLDTALSTIERLRLLALGIQVPGTAANVELPRVSFSAGLATTTDGPRTLDEIVARADAALYEAKDAGRDVVRISSVRTDNTAGPRRA